MLWCPTSTEYLTFQQRINNVATVFDLLEVITSQAWTRFTDMTGFWPVQICVNKDHSHKNVLKREK